MWILGCLAQEGFENKGQRKMMFLANFLWVGTGGDLEESLT